MKDNKEIFEIKAVVPFENLTDAHDDLLIMTRLDLSGLLKIIKTCAGISAVQHKSSNTEPSDIGLIANTDVFMFRDGTFGISLKDLALKPDFNPFGSTLQKILDTEDLCCDLIIVPRYHAADEIHGEPVKIDDEDDLSWLGDNLFI